EQIARESDGALRRRHCDIALESALVDHRAYLRHHLRTRTTLGVDLAYVGCDHRCAELGRDECLRAGIHLSGADPHAVFNEFSDWRHSVFDERNLHDRMLRYSRDVTRFPVHVRATYRADRHAYRDAEIDGDFSESLQHGR